MFDVWQISGKCFVMDRKYFGVSFIYFTDGNLHSFKTLEYKFTKQKYCFRIQCNFAEKRIVLNFKKKNPLEKIPGDFH